MKRIVIAFLVVLLYTCVSAYAGNLPSDSYPSDSLLRQMVLNRNEEVVVISNIPEDEVMSLVCKDVYRARGKEHFRYINTRFLGIYGKSRNDLVNYDWRMGHKETLVVIDRARLDKLSGEMLGRIMSEILPKVTPAGERKEVLFHIENVHKNEWVALIDAPSIGWLNQLVDEVRQIPKWNSNGGNVTLRYPVCSVAVMTNNDRAADMLLSAFKYAEKKRYGLGDWKSFQCEVGLTHKIVAVDWNGSEKCAPEVARNILPPQLSVNCDTSDTDDNGLNRWQRFCREVNGEAFDQDGTACWVFRSPTSKHLEFIVDTAVKQNFGKWPYSVQLCDFSDIDKVAVGVYLPNLEQSRANLLDLGVVQGELETVSREYLQSKAKITDSVPNWAEIVRQVVGDKSGLAYPLGDEADSLAAVCGADALLVLRITGLEPSETYNQTRQRLTPQMSPFGESEPRRPDCDDRDGFFGGHKYPGKTDYDREQSKEFEHDMRQYHHDHRDWERRKEDYERDRKNRAVNYEFTLTRNHSVTATGELRLIDLYTGKMIWSVAVRDSESTGYVEMTRRTVQVYGEETEPAPPDVPMNRFDWSDDQYPVARRALAGSLRDGLRWIRDWGLWPSDIKPWNTAVQLPPREESISLETVGAVPSASYPTETEKELLIEQACREAVDDIFAKVKREHPDMKMDKERVVSNCRIVSDGWNKEHREYRVRVKFEYSVKAAVPGDRKE